MKEEQLPMKMLKMQVYLLFGFFVFTSIFLVVDMFFAPTGIETRTFSRSLLLVGLLSIITMGNVVSILRVLQKINDKLGIEIDEGEVKSF